MPKVPRDWTRVMPSNSGLDSDLSELFHKEASIEIGLSHNLRDSTDCEKTWKQERVRRKRGSQDGNYASNSNSNFGGRSNHTKTNLNYSAKGSFGRS